MAANKRHDFQTIRSEGGLLPPDLLRRVLDLKEGIDGTRPGDYGLPQGERLNEVITQSWNRLRKHWAEFRAAAEHLPETEPGTGLTNDKWSLPLLRELGFGLLPTTAGPEIDGRTYAINRFFGPVPLHLVGCGLSLDRRAAGVRGAAAANPHGLVQEFINRSAGHLWAIVSNGLRLRLLRNNQALSRQSFLEFDLEAMFAGELYSDFVLLWLMAHATRFAPREGDNPKSCWLERWTDLAEEQGTRALGELRGGVEKALQMLGEGFTSHPKNTALRDGLRTGQVTLANFHGQLLRIVYRLIFLFVAEDRTLDGLALLHPRDSSEVAKTARERFALHYGTVRLREMAAKIKGSRHGDLWRQFQIIVGALSGDANSTSTREALALPALGSFLWDPSSTSALNAAELTNHDFLEALRDLAFTRQGKVLRPVDYENLGAEELGGVYESLLALTPQISADGARFTFAEFAGNERKTSGSYYTPDSLVQCLLDSALDPVVEEAMRGKSGPEAETAILALKVCDPAVGSGHFLVGAAHRLAQHLARIRAVARGDSEPSPLLYQHALRDVIGHCLYGVDVNPMAAELCRVSLWLEALEPGKPLSFLEHRIQCGNSLLGATPALLAKGIPDEVFAPIEGDEKEICKEFKRVNKDERNRQMRLFAATTEPWQRLGNLAVSLATLDAVGDDSLEGIREKQRLYEDAIRSADYLSGRFWADSWCAAFVWKKTREFSYPITEEVFRRIEHNPHAVDPWMRDEIQRLARQYQFFHWHLAFPDVFNLPPSADTSKDEQTGWGGGFDCVLGNPPWRMTEDDSRIEEEEFLKDEHELATDHTQLKRERGFFSRSGRFPLSAQNRLQLARLFAELFGAIRAASGGAGMIVPSTLTVNAFDRPLWAFWVQSGMLSCVWDFVNLASLFPEVDSRQKFALICLQSSGRKTFRARCWMTDPAQIFSQKDQIIELSEQDLYRYSGPELSLPHFRGRMDLALLASAISAYGRVSDSRDWATEYVLLGSTNDRDFVRERRRADKVAGRLSGQLAEEIPLYEGKMVGVYDHRLARVIWKAGNVKRRAQEEPLTDSEKADPKVRATPLWEVPRSLVAARDPSFARRGWDIALCDVTSALNERTAIPAVVPLCFATHSLPLVRVCGGDADSSLLFLTALASYALDYFARLRVATNHLTEGIFKSLPIPNPTHIRDLGAKLFHNERGIVHRALELSYPAWDLMSLDEALGFSGPPFRWDRYRRFLIRCEVDAAFFHLYLPTHVSGDWHSLEDRKTAQDLARLKANFPTPRHAVAYILDTFPIVRRKDEDSFNGDYRTKRVILEIYDAMQESLRTGQPYQTRLDPPPADPRCRHPKPEVGILAFGSLINDPGDELKQKIVLRIKTQTPFPIEYGRYSGTRGGAPTLVPHQMGAPVAAEILVLDESVIVDEATDMLWRRERRKVGSGERYVEGSSANSVLVRQFCHDPRVNTILYTNFHDAGKIPNPTARELAEHAIHSAEAADEGKDGITYLINAIKCGIETTLTRAYRDEILRQTNTPTLEEALIKVKEEVLGRRNAGRHE